MNQTVHWIIALTAIVLVGVIGTLYFRMVVKRRDETAAGIAALSAMSWRNFIHLLLDALALRGYRRVVDREAPSGDESFTLAHNGKQYLLSCKHGSAFVLGNAALVELGNAIRLADAAGGILVTQGRVAKGARPVAALQRIELLDGPTLWPELGKLIPPEQRTQILAGAGDKARQRTLLSWLLALVVGIAVFLVLPTPEPAEPSSATAQSASKTPAATAGHAATTVTTASDNASVPAPAPDDELALEKQRKQVADSVSTLSMVDRAVWNTSSTLQVYLLDAGSDAMPDICPLLVHYDALAASRVQLTPPHGSSRPTRFRQCRVY